MKTMKKAAARIFMYGIDEDNEEGCGKDIHVRDVEGEGLKGMKVMEKDAVDCTGSKQERVKSMEKTAASVLYKNIKVSGQLNNIV